MLQDARTRLRQVLGLIGAVVAAVLGMGGPEGTASALKATINYALIGTEWEAAVWLTKEGLLPLRPFFILGAVILLVWAFWPRRQRSKPAMAAWTDHTSSQTSANSPAYVRLHMMLGPDTALSPENRLSSAYAEFHRLMDQAEMGDAEAAKLAAVVAPWLRDAARFYWASSLPYHRIEHGMLARLAHIQNPLRSKEPVPPSDPDEIERGRWDLQFNPGDPNKRKHITFLPTGQIGEGRNQNEATWTLDGRVLTILRADGSLQNKFVHVPDVQGFVCVNDPNALGIRDQTIRRL